MRKAREEALQSNRDLEAQLAAESSVNQDLQVSAVSCRNYKCMLSVHIITFTNTVNINYQTNEVMERKIHHSKFISRIHVKTFFIYSLGKWIVFMEMIKAHSLITNQLTTIFTGKAGKSERKERGIETTSVRTSRGNRTLQGSSWVCWFFCSFT